MDDGSGVSRLSFDKLMEELGVTFAYVSEFLRKVRVAAVLVVSWSPFACMPCAWGSAVGGLRCICLFWCHWARVL